MIPTPTPEEYFLDLPLRLPAVCDIAQMSRSWVLAKVSAGEFPAPAFRLGRNAVAWRRRDVIAWLESKRIPRAD